MAALHSRRPGEFEFFGVGGPLMQAQGMPSLLPQSDLAVMGLFEVIPRLPKLWRHIRTSANAIRTEAPTAVITIDSPSFGFRVLKALSYTHEDPARPRFIHYTAPQVWAWRPGRVHKLARLLDHVLALLPFEPPYFEAADLPCSFVGHPIVERAEVSGDGRDFRRRHGISDDAKTLLLLPGSRQGEVTRHLSLFAETASKLQAACEGLAVIVVTLPHLRADILAGLGDHDLKRCIVVEAAEKNDAFAASDMALAASGTVALELAIARIPTVIAYRINPLTAIIARRVLTVDYVSLINILAGREIMPEFLQEQVQVDNLFGPLYEFASNPASRQAQVTASADMLHQLGAGQFVPSMRAADTVLALLEERENDLGAAASDIL